MVEWIFRAAVSSCCGTLIFLNINREKAAQSEENNNIKNTFLPFLVHVILCLIEHIIVVCTILANVAFKISNEYLC